MVVEKISFTVPENHRLPQLAAIGKMAEHPIYTEIFYLCGLLQSLHNLGLIEECGVISDSLFPLWWNLFYLKKDEMTPEKISHLLSYTEWPSPLKDKIVRLYEAYLKPDFFDRLTTK